MSLLIWSNYILKNLWDHLSRNWNSLEVCGELDTRKNMSYLEDGRHPMNSEIEYKTESMS
jgi:hypothetical protein